MPPSFGSLPEELQLAILARLGPFDRHQACPLVSKQWHSLVYSPRLLRNLALQVDSPACLRELAAWLPRAARAAGGHIDSLALWYQNSNFDDEEPGPEGEPGEAQRIKQLGFAADLASVLAAAGAGGSLSKLQVRCMGAPLSVGGWARLLPGLRRLCLAMQGAGNEELVLSPAADLALCLPALEALCLDGGGGLLVADSFSPPTSLTRLHLGTAGWKVLADLEQKMSTLQSLRHLSLDRAGYHPDSGYSALTTLPHLTMLAMTHCTHLPPSLPQLARLRALHLDASPFSGEGLAVAAKLAAAVQGCSQLTHLFLAAHRFAPVPARPVLEAVAGLRHLVSFAWSEWEPADETATLPAAGSWLTGLRQLLLPGYLAANSRSALLAAPCLEALAVELGRSWNAAAAEAAVLAGSAAYQLALLSWIGLHPSLRRVGVSLEEGEVAAAAEQAQQRWPGLHIQEAAELERAFRWHCVGAAGCGCSREDWA